MPLKGGIVVMVEHIEPLQPSCIASLEDHSPHRDERLQAPGYSLLQKKALPGHIWQEVLTFIYMVYLYVFMYIHVPKI